MTGDATHDASEPRWLLLIHQIPPKPDYLRVKIGRRLQRVGAIPVKNSVYVLPDREQSLEDFQWIRTEIVDGGGDASICRADFVDGLTSDQLRHLFRSARNEDFAEIEAAARELLTVARRSGTEASRSREGNPDEELARLRKRLAVIAGIDFFSAPGRVMADEAVALVAAEREPRRPTRAHGRPAPASRAGYQKRTWVTRKGIFVDRMASAWLIRRFIDPEARFKFVGADGYRPVKGELRYDMVGGDFTHEGDRCTFETLLDRFSLDDEPLRALAEVVHDVDLKDEKFRREDAPGIECVLAGIAATHTDDVARFERGCQLFDELCGFYANEASAARAQREADQ